MEDVAAEPEPLVWAARDSFKDGGAAVAHSAKAPMGKSTRQKT